MNTNSRSLTGGVSFTFAHCNDAGIPIRIDVEAVVAGLLNRECHVGSVDLVDLATKQVTDVQIQGSLMEFHLHGVVAHVGQRETGLRAHAHGARANVQLGARIFIRPHVVRNCQRAIQSSRDPVFRPAWLNGNRSRHVLQTRSSSRRIWPALPAIRRRRLLFLDRLLVVNRRLILGWLVIILRPGEKPHQEQREKHRQRYAL